MDNTAIVDEVFQWLLNLFYVSFLFIYVFIFFFIFFPLVVLIWKMQAARL